MNNTKEIFITAFALFALFFGAGNLLLPPLLGYQAGNDWFWVTLGFILTAVVIPIIGIFAHARLQGTMYDFAKKVSPLFSSIYCVLIYIIAVVIPSPRTAAATHEIAISPFFNSSSLLTSSIYFALVFVFVCNRSRILNIIGKFLTPFIVLFLLLVIGIGLYSSTFLATNSVIETPIVAGILEGYQTFDAIGAVVVGAVIIISINLKGYTTFETKKNIIKKAGLIAGLGLFIIYAGLISVGAYYGSQITVDTALSSDMQRAALLRNISISSLGVVGNSVLSFLIALACFTTAVGIVTGTADYFKGIFKNNQNIYYLVAFLACIFGVVIGQLNFNTIIVFAFPVLLFIYPITIVLILLNVLPEKYASKAVFRAVVIITFIFSIPDVLNFLMPSENISAIIENIPFASHNLAWVLPAILVFVVTVIFQKNKA
ncbi:MAG: branched-chain amino acid transport system II carrier protein [Oceanihabitans sp.]